VAEVDAIRIGTAFGGALVGLNLPDESRSFDALGYSALKFYLRPVDKRLPQRVYPLLGISFDVNRYMSIDLAGTLFAQPSLSPLTQNTNLRVGPVLGINFDGDLFNRFQTLFSGNQYQVNPGGN